MPITSLILRASSAAAARELAARPVRSFATESEALSRYRRVSGLAEALAPGSTALARGIHHSADGWQLAQDPATFAVAGAPFAALAAAARAPLVLACGTHDPMVTVSALRAYAPAAHEIPDAGHNVHVEAPATVLALVAPLLAAL